METVLRPFVWHEFNDRAIVGAGWRVRAGRNKDGFFVSIATTRGRVVVSGCADHTTAFDLAITAACGVPLWRRHQSARGCLPVAYT